MPLMGQREYARHRGCTLRAVQKALESGRIKTVDDGSGKRRIDSDQADRDWERNTDETRKTMEGLGRQRMPEGATRYPPPPEEDAEEPEELDGSDPSIADLRRARAAREKIRVEREQLELDQLAGRLIELDDAKRLAFTAFRTLRDAILNVPARLKDELAAEPDPLRVEQLLERELAGALEAVAERDLLREQGDEEDDGGD